jgi:hypothetical protein
MYQDPVPVLAEHSNSQTFEPLQTLSVYLNPDSPDEHDFPDAPNQGTPIPTFFETTFPSLKLYFCRRQVDFENIYISQEIVKWL